MLNLDKHKVSMFRLLTDMLRDPYLAAVFGFKGGTACYFFHGLPRFSVDLDFDIIASAGADAVQRVFGIIEKVVEASGFQIKDKNIKLNTVFFMLSYARDSHNVKIEVSRRDYPNTYELKDFYGMPVRVLIRSDIFAHKLVAATNRKKTASRDFFDIHFFLKEGWPINEEIIKARTSKKLKEYLSVLKDFIEKHINTRNVLQGLGELIDEKQKGWVRNELKNDLLRLISFYSGSLAG